MTVTVVNKYKEPNHVYCGRGNVLGNPYYMSNERFRNVVCDQYEQWFDKMLNMQNTHSEPFHLMLNSLIAMAKKGDVNLGCFCAPKRCHCDTIKAYIDEQLKE